MRLGRGDQAVDQPGVDKQVVAADAYHALGGKLLQGPIEAGQGVVALANNDWHVAGGEPAEGKTILRRASQDDHPIESHGIGHPADHPLQQRAPTEFSRNYSEIAADGSTPGQLRDS